MGTMKAKVLARLDVEAFYRQELGELVKRGSRWFGQCPFHADTDHSLSLDLEPWLQARRREPQDLDRIAEEAVAELKRG
jgi:hypothetical protein